MTIGEILLLYPHYFAIMVVQPMNQNKARVGVVILMLFAGMMLSACAGKKTKANSSESEQPVADITRPPQMVRAEQEVVEESDPDETISFDEWRKRRQAELDAQNDN